MPARKRTSSVTVMVTPRFEIFYALQVLESGSGERLRPWRREMERRLPSRARTMIASVAPSSLMWPLLADALSNEAGDLAFDRMVTELRSLDPAAFQRAVLGGVFKKAETIEKLASGSITLRRAVAGEDASRKKVLTLLGLEPFDAESAAAEAFERLVSDPSTYRDHVVSAIEAFWNGGFDDTWRILQPQMRKSARAVRSQVSQGTLDHIADEWKLPHIDSRVVKEVNLIPSAFNVSRLWAAYGTRGVNERAFIPYLDVGLSLNEFASDKVRGDEQLDRSINAAAVFRALGDTTRFAMATTLARTPMTSVELAKVFGVSKPTISHHVQLMRAANLLFEQAGENGVILSLDRRTLERASPAAAAEMFSQDGPDHVVRRSRKTNTTERK